MLVSRGRRGRGVVRARARPKRSGGHDTAVPSGFWRAPPPVGGGAEGCYAVAGSAAGSSDACSPCWWFRASTVNTQQTTAAMPETK